jgi:hypothetical protein
VATILILIGLRFIFLVFCYCIILFKFAVIKQPVNMMDWQLKCGEGILYVIKYKSIKQS